MVAIRAISKKNAYILSAMLKINMLKIVDKLDVACWLLGARK